jgi:hypothetical protein
VVAGERRVQRGVSVVVPRTRRDVGVVGEQQLRNPGMSEERRQVQRRPAVGAEAVDRRRIGREQSLHALHFAGGARLEHAHRDAARDQQIHYFLLAMVDSG